MAAAFLIILRLLCICPLIPTDTNSTDSRKPSIPESVPRTSDAPRSVVRRRSVPRTSPPLASRRRNQQPDNPVPDTQRPHLASSDWIDIDAPSLPKSKKNLRHHTTHRSSRASLASTASTSSLSKTRRSSTPKSPGRDSSRYTPHLGQIPESGDGPTSARRSHSHARSRESHQRRHIQQRFDRDESGRSHHRVSTRSRARRSEAVFKLNPSLLSLFSTLTSVSEHSGSSTNTVTQQSYDRAHGVQSTSSNPGRRRSELQTMSTVDSNSVNVFDFMDPPEPKHDTSDWPKRLSSISSASSSLYAPSDAGSSEYPGTPSSRSTFPSPTNTRAGSVSATSVQDLRKRYEPHLNVPSQRAQSRSPEQSARVIQRQHSMSNVSEVDTENESLNRQQAQQHYDSRRRSSSRASGSSHASTSSSRASRPVVQYPSHGPDAPDRSQSSSPASSVSSEQAHAYLTALERYRQSTLRAANSDLPTNCPEADEAGISVPPPVPEAPELVVRTIAGYEMLAAELSNADSSITPLYRKFDYLNHRLLLHMQDELGEMEEHLRAMDELIAQGDLALAAGGRTPASRRGDAYYGSDIHHRRTELLGRIFLKTEQYNRAMAAYGSLNKDYALATREDVASYRDWMQKKTPIHEIEASFLSRDRDLIMPGRRRSSASQALASPLTSSNSKAIASWLPAALLMLPLLLFASIPSIASRLAVTVLVAIAAGFLAAATDLRSAMSAPDWFLCGVTYVLFMIAMAGFIPPPSSV